MKTPEAFFQANTNDWFEPTDHCRGPWHTESCHAGPPTGLLARAVEALVKDKKLIRLTVNLLRPIPMAGFRIEPSITRDGKTVSTSTAKLVNADGKTLAEATGLHIAPQPIHREMPTSNILFGHPDDATVGNFPISTLHDLPAFPGGVKVKFPKDQSGTPGPTTVWLKAVPLLETETPSPFQRICPLADCGNAFGRNANPDEFSFVNPDLTIVLHRDPIGEWLGSSSVGYWEPNGLGMADAQLFDSNGVVGRAVQTLLLRPT